MKNRTDLFRDFILYYSVLSSKRYPDVPGGVIKNCNSAYRKELSELKSADIAENANPKEYWEGVVQDANWFALQEFRKLKTDFDKKLLGSANKLE